ncbi:MAG: N-acetylmuramoyl-L-alanine amidase, partial [Eubacteriales bacterium]|nr:N-acetylmuramoyl-L-alanine amidase [Eubacteriales bacterium]
LEKDVNLSVALCLRDYLEAAGIPTVLTRTQDKLLYDPAGHYRGRKKTLDLAARLAIAQAVPDSLFVSIHMNSFPQPQYSGVQVWYAPSDPASERVASCIQTQARLLAPANRRRPQVAGSNIFLLDRLETPAVLVEGGFLSNPAEAARLATDAYRQRLAFVLFLALSSCD